MTQLVGLFTAHCFFAGTCTHAEHALTPEEAHELMEAHYARVHATAIDRIVGWMR